MMFLYELLKQAYVRFIRPEDKLVIALALLLYALSCSLILVNQTVFHYTGINYVDTLWLHSGLFAFGGFALMAIVSRDYAPRTAFFTRTYCLFVIIYLAIGLTATGVQYTPFPVIDTLLASMDKAMGFNTVALMHWTVQHPRIQNILVWSYNSLYAQLPLIPIVLGLIRDERSTDVLFCAMMISFAIGGLFYYFFPTTAPVSIFSSPDFIQAQHHTLLKFIEVHQQQPVTVNDGGLIAMPSFHIIWALLITYALKGKQWLFYPLIVLNILLTLSTLLLGWHYLADVFGGILVAALAIYLSECLYSHYVKRQDTKEYKYETSTI